ISTWADTQSLDVSDANKITATRLGGAAPGGHDVTVSTLARSEQRSYTFAPGAATLQLGPSSSVSLSSTDDGQSAADKINAASGSPFYAVFVKDPLGNAANDKLVLTRKDTGYYDPNATDAIDVTGAGWTSSEQFKAGVNASFTVDGGDPQSSLSNVVTSAIP